MQSGTLSMIVTSVKRITKIKENTEQNIVAHITAERIYPFSMYKTKTYNNNGLYKNQLIEIRKIVLKNAIFPLLQ